MTLTQIAIAVDVLIKDRSRRLAPDEAINLVTSRPEAGATTNGDTSVVVRELFANAEESVLVAGYAVYWLEAKPDGNVAPRGRVVETVRHLRRQHSPGAPG